MKIEKKFKIYRNCKSIKDEENCMIRLNITLNYFRIEFSIWNEKM